jgi:DNA repair protein RadC
MMDMVQEVKTTVYRKIPSNQLLKITCSKDLYDILKNSWDALDYVETMKLVLLNTQNKVLGIKTISTGGTATCLVDVKVIFQTALLCNASYIVLAHNHPSGELKASDADLSITRKVKNAGEIMGIKLIDHIIISDIGYTSFADEGIL